MVLAACASGGGALPDAEPTTTPSVPSSVPTSSDTTPPAADPYAIPDVIDAAYVNRVLAALYRIDGDALREVLGSMVVGRAPIDLMAQAFSSPQLEVKLEDLMLVLDDDPAIYKVPPGDRRVTVESLALVSPTCIVALVKSDFSDVVVNPAPRDPGKVGLVVLVPVSDTVRANGVNPTPWSISLARLIGRNDPPLAMSPCG